MGLRGMSERRWMGAVLIAASLLAGAAAARAEDWCQGACKATKARLVERLAAIDTAAVTPCRTKVQSDYDALKHKSETCDCYPPAVLSGLLKDLAQAGDKGLANCKTRGLDAQAAYLAEQEKAHVARLRGLISQFQSQTRQLEALSKDADQGMRDAWGKIGEVAFAALLTAIIDGNQKDIERSIDGMVERASKLKNPRAVRAGDLKEWIDALRHDLKGKTKAEAKAMILASLDKGRTLSRDLTDIEKQLAGLDAKLAADAAKGGPPSTATDIALDQAYASVVTGLQIARNHGVGRIATLAQGATVLGVAPQAIDVAELLYRAKAIDDNVEGVDKLYTAAEQQRVTASIEYRLLVDQRRQLQRQRP